MSKIESKEQTPTEKFIIMKDKDPHEKTMANKIITANEITVCELKIVFLWLNVSVL